MIEFILAFLVLLTVVTIMSVGVIRGRPPIAGSCGGLNSMGVDGGCEICGGDVVQCKEKELTNKPSSSYPQNFND